ncbi:MAG: hypothetical protein D6B25_12570 [Desulfobulbaceae bacterium]|nr:MAG: hypothetical protein D6B25_12570 [Desulfobulbaceae bacterium]
MSTAKIIFQLALRIPCCILMLYLLWLLTNGVFHTISSFAIPFNFSSTLIKILHYSTGSIFLLIGILVVIQIFKPLFQYPANSTD